MILLLCTGSLGRLHETKEGTISYRVVMCVKHNLGVSGPQDKFWKVQSLRWLLVGLPKGLEYSTPSNSSYVARGNALNPTYNITGQRSACVI